jgi:hypothetical protein
MLLLANQSAPDDSKFISFNDIKMKDSYLQSKIYSAVFVPPKKIPRYPVLKIEKENSKIEYYKTE